jgi:hypothetical protein
MWLRALIFLVLIGIAALVYGTFRWRAGTRELRAQLEAARQKVAPAAPALPAPVARYLALALPPNQPPIAAVNLTHTGTFNLGATTPHWVPFTSTQRVVTNRPGFDWDARIHMAPGVDAYVHDAYVDGVGILQVEALAVLPMVDLRDTHDVAQGELQRFLAEAAWYPTRLRDLPWQPIDANAAQATLHDGETTVALTFHFNADGLIDTVHAASRPRVVDGVATPTPWEGRFWNYELHNGIRIPADGEVSWLLPDGPFPYWRGHLTHIDFEFERPS